MQFVDVELHRARVFALAHLLASPDVASTIGTWTLDLLRRETNTALNELYWKGAGALRERRWEMRRAHDALTLGQDALRYLDRELAREELCHQIQECQQHLIQVLGAFSSSFKGD